MIRLKKKVFKPLIEPNIKPLCIEKCGVKNPDLLSCLKCILVSYPNDHPEAKKIEIYIADEKTKNEAVNGKKAH